MKIGITGGIGSGKTFVANRLKAEGYPVYNCDDEAKRLMVQRQEIRSQLSSLLGSEAYRPDGQLNKRVVSAYLFGHPSHAARINAIVHPAVKADFEQWASRQTAAHCFMESAILYEARFESTVQKVILVCADEQTRLQRAMQRDQATEQQIRARMAQQLPPGQLMARADYTVNNSATADTDAEFHRLLHWLASLSSPL